MKSFGRAFYTIFFSLLIISRLPAAAQGLSKAAVSKICRNIMLRIDSSYVIKENRGHIIRYLDSNLKVGSYKSFTSPDSLAAQLTTDLRKASKDKHLYVQYVSEGNRNDSFDWSAWSKQEKINEIDKNFGFTELAVMQGNIGYMRIVECMNPDRGIRTAISALLFLENTKGLIIDLRGNGGGYGGLQDLILASYFDEEPTHISTFISNESTPNKVYTLPFTFGKRRIGTPLCILIDRKTGSAAEFFAYTLQAFEKAIIVGEPSAGAAHMNTYYPLGEGFLISVSTGAPINPITMKNWEGAGVIPDIIISPEMAKQKAWEEISKTLTKKRPEK